jgi:hypothetical protein
VVVLSEGLIESTLLYALGQQFGDMAASIVDGLPLADGFAVKDVVTLQQRAARGINLDLKFHSQFVAVAQHGLVNGGQARRAAVEVISVVEGTSLRGAIVEGQLRSGAQGPVAPAGTLARFQHGAVEASPLHFIGRDQPGNSGAENNHFGSAAGRWGQGKVLPLLGFDHAQKSQRVHGHEGSAITAGLRDSGDELASADRHLLLVPGRALAKPATPSIPTVTHSQAVIAFCGLV